MKPILSPQSRKSFVKWGLGVIASLAVIRIGGSAGVMEKKAEQKTIKMLGQDGQLVEVMESTMTAHRKKISDDELKNWIKK